MNWWQWTLVGYAVMVIVIAILFWRAPHSGSEVE